MVISMFGVKLSSKQVCGGKITQCSQISRLCGHRFLSHILKFSPSWPKSSMLSFLSTQDPFPFKMYQFKSPKIQSLQRFQRDHLEILELMLTMKWCKLLVPPQLLILLGLILLFPLALLFYGYFYQVNLFMVAGASGCLLTFILGYNSLNDRLKDLEKEEREWVRDQEKKEEELEKIKIVR